MSVYLIDFETTGTDPWRDAPVSVALFRVDGSTADPIFVGRCNPGVPIPEGASQVHGITDADVASERAWVDVAAYLHDRVAHDVTGWAAYNAPYDLTVLFRAWDALDLPVPRVPVVCGLVMARQVWRSKRDREAAGLPNLKLASVCSALGVELANEHDASADAVATLGAMAALRRRLVEERRISASFKLADLSRWCFAHGVDTDRWFLDNVSRDQLTSLRRELGRPDRGPAQDDETPWGRMYALMGHKRATSAIAGLEDAPASSVPA